jgi:hypothetical protein
MAICSSSTVAATESLMAVAQIWCSMARTGPPWSPPEERQAGTGRIGAGHCRNKVNERYTTTDAQKLRRCASIQPLGALTCAPHPRQRQRRVRAQVVYSRAEEAPLWWISDVHGYMYVLFVHDEASPGVYIEDEVTRGHTPCRDDDDAPPDSSNACGLMGCQEAPMTDRILRTNKTGRPNIYLFQACFDFNAVFVLT